MLTSQVLPKSILVDSNHPLVCCTRKQRPLALILLSVLPNPGQSLHLLKHHISHVSNDAKNIPAGLCRGSVKQCVGKCFVTS